MSDFWSRRRAQVAAEERAEAEVLEQAALAEREAALEEKSDAELLAHPALRDRVETLLGIYNKTAGGSSLRVPHVRFLEEPLSLDKGEVTDKGSVNQRAVLRLRADLADSLFTGAPEVMHSRKPA